MSGSSSINEGWLECRQCRAGHPHATDKARQLLRLPLGLPLRTTAAGPACAPPHRSRSGWWRSAPPGTGASRGTCARCRTRRRSRSRRGSAGRRWPPPSSPWRRRYLAILAWAPIGSCASNSSQAFQRIRLAASSSMNDSAIGNCTPWLLADGPVEDHALGRVRGHAVHEPVAVAHALGGDQHALGVQAVEDVPEALAFLADQVLLGESPGPRRTARWSRG